MKKQAKIRKNLRKNIVLFNSTLLKALGDENRQYIILILGREGEMCVTSLSSYFDIARPSISHHLKVLKEAKIVVHRKEGKEIFYSLNHRYITRSLNNILRLILAIKMPNFSYSYNSISSGQLKKQAPTHGSDTGNEK